MNKIRLPLLLLITCSLFSCNSDTNQSEIYFQNVDADLWVFFDAFEKEGRKRGFNVDLDLAGITGEISNINDQGVIGTCQYGSHIHHVTIDQEFWNNANFDFKEYVVFHELGHCYLDRGHNDAAFANGNCVSIMHSGLTNCRINYGGQTRTDMIDELFYN